MPENVRVRFAPSPTGLLHIGGLRTALYNYAFARRNGGSFILRIEDTDRERYEPEAEPDILASLAWAGLEFDEGPSKVSDVGPFYQSERQALYQKYARELVERGDAYYAFDSREELDALRQRDDGTARYDAASRESMRNSLTLDEPEWRALLEAGTPFVIRLKVQPDTRVYFDDLVRGTVTFDSSEIDDQVLFKSDGMPTYHLANVVDDHLMGITHVIRGEEWLPSTPKHVLLYKSFGWQAPRMAHLPLILNPEGGKLSKRDTKEVGIPVSVQQYREAGYEPEALINFLALLGWNPGDEREVFTLSELTDEFSLERVGSSGVRFSMDKLRWYNGEHLRRLSIDAFLERAKPAIESQGFGDLEPAFLRDVAELMQPRVSFAREVATEGRYFFSAPESYDEKGVKKRWKADSGDLVRTFADRIEAADSFTSEGLEDTLRTIAEEHEAGAGRIIHPTRLALSGVTFGPGLFEMMVLIGKDECVRRMRKAAEVLH